MGLGHRQLKLLRPRWDGLTLASKDDPTPGFFVIRVDATGVARVGCHCRIGVLSPAEHRSYGRERSDSRALRASRTFPGRDRSSFEDSDGLIEAGECPDRSGLRRSSVVLVNQATQQIPASDRVVEGGRRDVFRSLRRNKVEPAMGSLAVVVLDVRLQHRAEMSFAQKEHPIEALGADRSDEPFGIGVGLRRPPRSAQDLDPLGPEYLVEDGAEPLVPVMNQVADRVRSENSIRSPSCHKFVLVDEPAQSIMAMNSRETA